MLAFSGYWFVGWAVGLVVVLVAAALLLTLISVARGITRQAQDITAALDGARANTASMFDVVATNHAIDRVARGLRRARTGSDEG